MKLTQTRVDKVKVTTSIGATLESEFSKLEADSNGLRERVKRYAEVTLPFLVSDESDTGQEDEQLDYQSYGAQLVNNLANVMTTTLFNPARPFFRIDANEKTMGELREIFDTDVQVKKRLGEIEREGLKQFNKTNSIAQYTQAEKLAIVTGDAVIKSDPDGTKTVYSLPSYVLKRSNTGSVYTCILKEVIDVANMPQDLIEQIKKAYPQREQVHIYTGMYLINGRWKVWQEVENDQIKIAHLTEGSYPKGKLPYDFRAWELKHGRDYGVGLVEQYAGEFEAYSHWSKAVVDYTTILTDLKILVSPMGQTNIRDVNESASGAAIPGDEADVHVLSYGVTSVGDYLESRAGDIRRRLGAVFLLTTAVTRDAERVTAEEIRRNVLDLNKAHSGNYANAAIQLQVPEAKRILQRVGDELKEIDVIVLTGLEALSRESELDRWRGFFADLKVLAEVPENILQKLDVDGLITVLGTGHGVPYEDVLLVGDDATAQATQRGKLDGILEKGKALGATQGELLGQQ